MKTAILISGQARSFAKVYLNQNHMCWSRLPEPHFFVSVADDEDADAVKECLLKLYPSERVKFEKVVQPEQAVPKNLDDLLAAGPNDIAAHSTVQGILKQFWHLVRVAEFAGGVFGIGREFDLVVRCRPDIKFHSFPDAIDLPPGAAVALPWWSRSGGVNDRFAIMRPAAVVGYFYALIWAKTQGWAAGAPIHPESMLAASLRSNGVTAHCTLPTAFSIVRKNGELILPDPSFADIADLLLNRTARIALSPVHDNRAEQRKPTLPIAAELPAKTEEKPQ